MYQYIHPPHKYKIIMCLFGSCVCVFW